MTEILSNLPLKILITGATGFIGRHLYAALKNNHEVYALCRRSSNIEGIPADYVKFYDGDIDELTGMFEAEKFDGVIHVASLVYSEMHQPQQIADLIDSNVTFGTILLDTAVRTGVKWFINTGSIWQNYESPDYSDAYNPVNLYAASKQAFITIAKYYTEISAIRFSTLKICDTYGPNDNRRKIFTLFDEIAQNGETLDMTTGYQLIDMVHIDTVVQGFERLMYILSNPDSTFRPEYVVTSGDVKSLRCIAAEYEEKNNVKLNINWGARPHRLREVMKPYKGWNILDD